MIVVRASHKDMNVGFRREISKGPFIVVRKPIFDNKIQTSILVIHSLIRKNKR